MSTINGVSVGVVISLFLKSLEYVTNLFGGSVGREGTGVQIGASICAKLGELLKLDESDKNLIIISGISSGFGVVFIAHKNTIYKFNKFLHNIKNTFIYIKVFLFLLLQITKCNMSIL